MTIELTTGPDGRSAVEWKLGTTAGHQGAWAEIASPYAGTTADAGAAPDHDPLAGFGAAMWWFWFVRLGTGASPTARAPVTVFYVLGLPVAAVGCTVGWWYGLRYVTMVLYDGLNLDF